MVIFIPPKVSEVVFVGKPDPVKGEVPVAFVSLKPGEKADAEEIREYLVDKLAKYKIPMDYIFLEYIPKTAQGKTQKDELMKILKEKES